MNQTSLLEMVDATAEATARAAPEFAGSTGAERATLLRALAAALEAERNELVRMAAQETGLSTARLEGELDRTTFQLRFFAQQAEDGRAHARIDDPAEPGAPPQGHPHLVRIGVPLGPVAMFAASNFPFAFSVLGGDTAAALAAGCPVVVKAHPGHPGLSRAVLAQAVRVIRDMGWPEGLLTLVEGAGHEVGLRLAQHPAISAVAFTGSFRGGQALWRACNARPRPIPFFGELGSINPIVALAPALRKAALPLAQVLAASIASGSGQFCTSPGLVLAPSEAEFDAFAAKLGDSLRSQPQHRMLTQAMREAFEHGVAHWLAHPELTPLLYSAARDGEVPSPVVMQTSVAAFIADPALREEVFGPAALVVRFASTDGLLDALRAVGGSLTVTLWGLGTGSDDDRRILATAQAIAGRVLFEGVPTGVAISPAQHHGGPWPASTAPQTSSVGGVSIERFLRPVALQEPPAWVLADALGLARSD